MAGNERTERVRLDPSLVERARCFSSATLHEAMGRKGALPSEIKPIGPWMRLCGPATTARTPPMDNLTIHRAIYRAEPGDVLVVETRSGYQAGYWGEIMTCAAQERRIAGLVIDGCVRDGNLIQEMGFPVFSRGLAIHGTTKEGLGTVNERIHIGDVAIESGDLILGDGDGVLVIARSEIASVLQEAQKRDEKEARIKEEIRAGRSTLEIYGWK